MILVAMHACSKVNYGYSYLQRQYGRTLELLTYLTSIINNTLF